MDDKGERVYDIKAAAEHFGYTETWIRKLIREDKIKTEQIPISPGAKVVKYVISETAMKEYENRPVTSRSHRKDSNTKWVTYAKFSDMEEIIQLLRDNGFGHVADLTKPWNELKLMPDWLKEHLDATQQEEMDA